MTRDRWAAVDRYLAAAFVHRDAGLDAAAAAREAAGLPPVDVSPGEGKFLYLLARVREARAILEVGTFAGYSTIWLARALPPDGRLVTLEIDPARAALARANVARAGLATRVDMRVGPALDTLPRLAAEGAGPFDLIFLDADKRNNPGYLEWSLRLARPGTLIVDDNIVRGGAVADPETRDPDALGVRRFNEMVAADPRLAAAAMQTVGAKGWDGLALVLVEAK